MEVLNWVRGHLFLKSFSVLSWDWEQLFPVLFFSLLYPCNYSFPPAISFKSNLHISSDLFCQSYFPVFWTINPSELKEKKQIKTAFYWSASFSGTDIANYLHKFQTFLSFKLFLSLPFTPIWNECYCCHHPR